MKLFRSIIFVVLALCLMMTLVACDNKTDEPADETTDVKTTVADETTAEPEDDKVTYTITVVDESNAPISGVMVSFCDDENCFPGMTDASGVATFSRDEGEYKVSVANAVGYVYDSTEYLYFEDGSYEMTITLAAAE